MPINHQELFEDMLKKAESQYGPKVPGWTFTVTVDDTREVAESVLDCTTKTGAVYLTSKARDSFEEARYQIAHEAVHCLAATATRKTLRFEEGLAVAFAISWVSLVKRVEYKKALPPIFASAYLDFLSLGRIDALIKEARKSRPRIDDFDAAFLIEQFGAPKELAEKLTERFPEDLKSRK